MSTNGRQTADLQPSHGKKSEALIETRMGDTGVLVALVLSTASITAALVAPVRAFMLRRGVVDSPNHRSSHRSITPRGGGVACLVAVVIGAIGASLLGLDVGWMALTASVLLALLGLADDHFQLPALPRLGGQMLIGGVAGWLLGGPVWLLIGAGVTVVLVNAVNFMDGINGITALTMTVWGVVLAVIGITSSLDALAVTGALTAGASVGFLPWNAPNARIFLGDVGSYLFGGLAASGVLVAGTSSQSNESKFALMGFVVAPLLVYLVDVFATIAKRAVRGASLFEAHREHVYQLAAARLPGHLPVAIGVAALSGAVAIIVILAPVTVALPAVGVIVALYLCVPAMVGRVSESPAPTPRKGRP